MPSPFVLGLKCRVCGTPYPMTANNFCTEDFGPLEVDYDYDSIAEVLTREKIEMRPHTMWRYQELLPLDGEPTVGTQVGGTPLVKADRLAKELGVERLWIKNDAVNFPTLSFKDRVVAVALCKAREFGYTTVGCASTGNLANSVAANAAAAGLDSYIFVPSDPRADQDPRHQRLRLRQGDRRSRRHLRPGEPPVYASGVQVRLGLRQHQPSSVLRRGLQDLRLRDRRGSRLALAATRRLSDGGRQPDRQDPQVIRRTGPFGSGCRRTLQIPRRASNRLQPHLPRGEEQPGNPPAGAQAEHDRQIAGHRRPGGRLLRRQDDPRIGRLGRGRERSRYRPIDGPACTHRRHLRGNSGRRDGGGGAQADRARLTSARDEEIVVCITGNGL